jgi:mono/diheme cytochrome c family protein
MLGKSSLGGRLTIGRRLATRPTWFVIASALASGAAPTFNTDVAPILYQNCATCHRPGEVAPFPLLTYQDAAKRAKQIAAVTESRFMPPWKAQPGHGSFLNERRLTDAQIATLRDWAAGGAPEGNPAAKPAQPTFPEGWQVGQPDKVFKLPEEFSLAADGPDQYRCFVIPMHLDQDVYIKSFEFRPGNRRVVHHAIVFTDPTGVAHNLADKSGSYPCFGGPGFGPTGILGGWAPGGVPGVQPKGMAITVRKGTDLVLQVHYHPSGKPEVDQSSLGMTFGDPPTVGRGLILVNSRAIDIPPGESHYVVKTGITIPQDVEVLGITPHAHYLGRDMKVDARLPDGTVTPLIWIKDWDFNWQGQYRYADRIKLPKGTRVELEYTYDNSAANPRNPSSPPVRVHWGEQTKDEMALAFLAVVLPSPADEAAFQRAIGIEALTEFFQQSDDVNVLPQEISPAQRDRLKLAIALFDKNHDGKLDAEERKGLIDFIRGRTQ